MTSPLDSQNAALHLEGLVLEGGWVVGSLIAPDEHATGGLFSVSYIATRADGVRAFLKVINLAGVLGDIDRLQAAVNEYISERDLLLMCGEQRLSHVVTAVGHGQVTLPNLMIPQVNYILFELATSDIRIALSKAASIDLVVRLEMVHHLAVGLRQLHRHRVAHQDIKPSNFLVFPPNASQANNGKIADLGRAFREGFPTMHDAATRPGDMTYAPPEQLYRYEYPDLDTRRFAADLYQLGSMIAFIFGNVTVNSLLTKELAPEHHWKQFGDGYLQALPYVIDAHARAMEQLRISLPVEVQEPLAKMVRYLTTPDAPRRGHPNANRQFGPNYALERVIGDANLLVRRVASHTPRTR